MVTTHQRKISEFVAKSSWNFISLSFCFKPPVFKSSAGAEHVANDGNLPRKSFAGDVLAVVLCLGVCAARRFSELTCSCDLNHAFQAFVKNSQRQMQRNFYPSSPCALPWLCLLIPKRAGSVAIPPLVKCKQSTNRVVWQGIASAGDRNSRRERGNFVLIRVKLTTIGWRPWPAPLILSFEFPVAAARNNHFPATCCPWQPLSRHMTLAIGAKALAATS